MPAPAFRRAPLPCEADPDLFFPVSTEGLSVAQIARAKTACRPCPIRADYLTEARTRCESELCVRGGELFDPATAPRQAPPPSADTSKTGRARRKDAQFDLAEYQWLKSFGTSDTRIACTFGITAKSVQRAVERCQQQERARQCASQPAVAS